MPREFSEEDRPLNEEEDRRFVVNLIRHVEANYSKILGSTIQMFTEDYSWNWKFEVDLKSFEVLHGISRVVKLTADKLAVAIAINLEENLRFPDDGTFFVGLVVELLDRFLGLIQEVNPDLNRPFTNFSVDFGPNANFPRPLNGHCNLQDVLTAFKKSLNDLILDLKSGNKCRYIPEAERALQIADNLLPVSLIFMDFIHPIWIQIQRSGYYDLQFLEEKKSLCNAKLAANKGRCISEFSSRMGDLFSNL